MTGDKQERAAQQVWLWERDEGEMRWMDEEWGAGCEGLLGDHGLNGEHQPDSGSIQSRYRTPLQ